MKCPPEIVESLVEILQIGLLRIRNACQTGDVERCRIESDHLHNLPGLITHYSRDFLEFYWNTERTSYLEQSNDADTAAFDEPWKRLEAVLHKDVVSSK